MLNRAALCALFVLAASLAWGQVINQDAAGKSSILTPGGTIGVDVQAASAKANYYSATDRTHGLLLGFELQGKSENGLAALFSKSDFVPSGRLSGLVGYQVAGLRNNAGLLDRPARVQAAISPDPAAAEAAEAQYQRLAEKALAELAVSCPDVSAAYKSALVDFIGPTHFGWDDIGSLSKALKPVGATPTACETAAVTTVEQLQRVVNNDKTIQDYVALRATAARASAAVPAGNEAAGNASSYKLYFYARGGVNATGFTYDRAGKYAAAAAAARFRDTSAVLPFVELGLSGRFGGSHFWGATLGLEKVSSFSLLDKATYKYTATAIPLASGSLSSSKDITAYAGELATSGRVYLNVDYLWLKPLERPSYLALNPYVRLNSQAQDKLYKASLAVGVGTYFIDGKSGKFLGGIYLQSDDVSGRTTPDFGKTITFGIIAKLAFGALFGLGQN